MSSQDTLKKLFDKETELREQLKEQQILLYKSEQRQSLLLGSLKELQDKETRDITENSEELAGIKRGLWNALEHFESEAHDAKTKQEGLNQEIQKTELAAKEEAKNAALHGELILKADYTTKEERDKQDRLKEENRQGEEAGRSFAEKVDETKKKFLAEEERLKDARWKNDDRERKEFQEHAADSVDKKKEKQDEKVKNDKQFSKEVQHPSDGGGYKVIDTADVTALSLFALGTLAHTAYEKFKEWRDKTEKTINEGLTREPSVKTARDNAALALSNKEEMELWQLKKEQDEQNKAWKAKFEESKEEIKKNFNTRHEFTDPVKRAELWEKVEDKFKDIEKQQSQKSIDQRERLLQEQERRREDEFRHL